MKLMSLHKSKRLPTTIGILLSGVAFAGFVASVIETPVGSNDYLHEHLTPSAAEVDSNWGGDRFELPSQDRLKLAAIVVELERPDWTAGTDAPVTGQALVVAKDTACSVTSKRCRFAIRLNREFSELHTNRDLRVSNIKETSLRVNFDLDSYDMGIAIGDMSNETRLFRFYQTQAGWLQKTSEVLETEPLDIEDRAGKFATQFSTDFVGINYYPASASWKEFWTEFPMFEIKSDLKVIKGLGANSVRIFLNHEYFDDENTQDDAKAKLQLFLNLCAAQNIQVLVTLFDLRPNYSLSNMKHDIEHIDKVLATVSDHPAILGIDIKNQADLDFAGWGQGLVEGWLTVMARYIQVHYPDLPVTVGWSQSGSAMGLKDVVDFVTYHEYGNPTGFAERLDAIKSEAGDKPVMITELGSTIWNPLRTTNGAEVKQASRLETQLEQSHAANGIFIWTLNDFDHVGSDVVGRRPWRKAQQRHFGLIRPDGSARPAINVLRTHAAVIAAQSTH